MPAGEVVPLFLAVTLAVVLVPLTSLHSWQIIQHVRKIRGCQQRGGSEMKRTLSMSVVTSLSLSMAQCSYLLFICMIVHIFRLQRDKHGLWESSRRDGPVWWLLAMIFAMGYTLGRVGLVIVLGERMHSVFAHSNYQMSDRTINGYRSATAIVCGLIMSQVITFNAGWIGLCVMLMLVDTVIYGGCSLALAWSFLDRSRLVCASLLSSADKTIPRNFGRPSLASPFPSNTVSSDQVIIEDVLVNHAQIGSDNHQNTNATDSTRRVTMKPRSYSAQQLHATEMMDASLRIMLVSSIGISSTVMVNISHMVILVHRDPYLAWVSVILTMCDLCLNNFTLLCSFRDSVEQYRLVFGCLHDYCRSQMGYF